MTTTIRTASRTRKDRGSVSATWRALTWALHAVVTLLALFSILTGRFDLWVDLRGLGWAGTLLEILWAATVLLVPFCAGPGLWGLRKPSWINRGFAPPLANALLWPTHLMLLCLVGNTVYFFVLVGQGVLSWDIPLPLLVAAMLGAWVLLTREWVRASHRMADTAPASRRAQLGGAAFAGMVAAGVGLLWFLHSYSRPPKSPVDLAVVLGYRVLPTGEASAPLRERALVAADLYKRGWVRHILVSGAVGEPEYHGAAVPNEPAAMAKVCEDAGVPAEAISLDPVGVNTRATAYNTAIFMKEHGYRSVVVCTTDFHLYRTMMSLREMGIEAYSLPAKRIEWSCAGPRDDLREVIGIVVYQINPNYRAPKAETMKLVNPRVVVKKSAKTLELFDGAALVKTYACITGGNAGDKEVEGDRKTPIGKFHIVFKNPKSKFHLSLGLDYPNREDAERGLKAGLINRPQYDQILSTLGSDLSLEENQNKLWKTPLGGEIFLHGHAEGRTGTAGCVALTNPDIEELYAILPVGTPVEIQE